LFGEGEGNSASRAMRVAGRFSGVTDPVHVLMFTTRKPGGPVLCRHHFHDGRAEEILNNKLSFVNGESDRTIEVKMQANNIDKESLEDRGVCGAKGSG